MGWTFIEINDSIEIIKIVKFKKSFGNFKKVISIWVLLPLVSDKFIK